MAQLSDFSTLDEARAYIERIEKPESGRMINERGVFALIGMESGERLMTAIEQAPNIPARVKAWFKPSEHGIDITATAAQAILAGMVAEQVITQAEADTLTNHAYIVTRPFENVTQAEFDLATPEELALVSNATQHTINFRIATSAPKITKVEVMQRYGESGDLTPWHVCGGTNVLYAQSRYKVMVPAVDAPIREMKLVCDYSLGLSVE